MRHFKLHHLIIIFLFIILFGCESDESKIFRKECYDFETKTILDVEVNWKEHLQLAIQEELRENYWDKEWSGYGYFSYIFNNYEPVWEKTGYNPWRYDIVKYRDLPGYYSCVLSRSFSVKNNFGQFGFFSMFFIKTRTKDWRLMNYELEVF